MSKETLSCYCPHCRALSPHRPVRQKNQAPLLWCQTCFFVHVVDSDIALSVDPLHLPPALSTTVAQLDEDHRQLSVLFNALHEAAAEDVEEAGQAMIGHLERHFRREERFLREIGYPLLAEHRSQHLGVLGEASELVRQLPTATAEQHGEIVLTLKFSFIEHLLDDMQYKSFLSTRTAQPAVSSVAD